MRKNAIFSALLLVAVGVTLGATVFRTDIAQATGLAQAVTVSNTPAQAVPVREQNLDGQNIKVHEQGTASVNVTGGTLAIGSLPTATKNHSSGFRLNPEQDNSDPFTEIKASAVVVSATEGNASVVLLDGSKTVLRLFVTGNQPVTIPFTERVAVDEIATQCTPFGTGCVISYSVIGD